MIEIEISIAEITATEKELATLTKELEGSQKVDLANRVTRRRDRWEVLP